MQQRIAVYQTAPILVETNKPFSVVIMRHVDRANDVFYEADKIEESSWIEIFRAMIHKLGDSSKKIGFTQRVVANKVMFFHDKKYLVIERQTVT